MCRRAGAGVLGVVAAPARLLHDQRRFRLEHELNYAAYAQLLGLTGIRVEHADDVGEAWDRAFAADRPVVLDVLTDPNVPPLPPHVTFKQARNFAAALMRGDPDALKVVKATAKEWWAEKFPSAV